MYKRKIFEILVSDDPLSNYRAHSMAPGNSNKSVNFKYFFSLFLLQLTISDTKLNNIRDFIPLCQSPLKFMSPSIGLSLKNDSVVNEKDEDAKKQSRSVKIIHMVWHYYHKIHKLSV